MTKDKGKKSAKNSQLSLFDYVEPPLETVGNERSIVNNTVCFAAYRDRKSLNILIEELRKSGILASMRKA